MNLFKVTTAEEVRSLIELGADVHARTISNSTPLHYAKDEGAVRALIEAGADVHARSNGNNTPYIFPHVQKVYETFLLQQKAIRLLLARRRYNRETSPLHDVPVVVTRALFG